MIWKEKIVQLVVENKKSQDISTSFPLDYCIPVYHNVSDEKLDHINHIIPYKNTSQFRDDLDFFSKYFQFVTWDEFKDFQEGKFKPKKKIALLTFDDGYREFRTVIAPILQQKGIFAINFINPKFIDNQEMMFRCKASLLIEAVKNSTKISTEISEILELKSFNKDLIISKFLKIKYQDEAVLDEAAPFLEVNFKEYLEGKQPYLNIEDLHYLKNNGFGIGAHSFSHPLYHEISLQEQLEQTITSLQYLQKNVLPNETFAFPFTDFEVRQKFFTELFKKEKNLKYTFGCAGIKRDSFEKNIQRIPMENGKTAQETIQTEMAYFEVKKWFNKNVIKRK